MRHSICFVSLRRPLAVYLALLIAVFAAVAPTLSHALARVSSGTPIMVEICTSNGPRWVALTVAADAPDGQGTAPHIEHCPFCLQAMDRVLPVSPVAFMGVRVLGEAVRPTMGQAYFFISLPVHVPPPRGPPVF